MTGTPLSAMGALRRRALLAEGLDVPAALHPPKIKHRPPIIELGSNNRLRRDDPFMGVDGEGGGRNRHGQQHYKLLRIGPHELYTGRPLTTLQCLDFICSAPAETNLIGFAFGYDTTQILRDLSPERVDYLFAEKPFGPLRSLWWNDFAIEYIPRNYLKVWRLGRGERLFDVDGKPYYRRYRIKGSGRTIWECFGFFQCSFLKALRNYDIGREHWPTLKRNKARRSKFGRMTREIRRYCAIECDLLAELMTKFRSHCYATGLTPRTWSGAGKLADALHRKHQTITARELAELVPKAMLSFAQAAYYGGRFEITRTGEVAGPIYANDINSAYPAAMRDLPCLRHGRWNHVGADWLKSAPASALFIAALDFKHGLGFGLPPLCGLPVRTPKGILVWPGASGGTYWSPEIRSAEALGAVITYNHGWRYIKQCDCHSFDWIEPIFNYRKTLPQEQGTPIKLGIASLYGKMAQHIGAPTFANMIYAGLITARVRARLNHAIALDPKAIVMLATDAVFSTRPLALDFGPGLGQWSQKIHPRLFIVQPGLYWGADRPKTRGIPTSDISRHCWRFEAVWRRWCETQASDDPTTSQRIDRKVTRIPKLTINLNLFTGLRLAHTRGKPKTAGRWDKTPKAYDFDWLRKRRSEPVFWSSPLTVHSLPYPDAPRSIPHGSKLLPAPEDMWAASDIRHYEAEQQDWIELAPQKD
jgi:DNA polymerase type B, organellar and viral